MKENPNKPYLEKEFKELAKQAGLFGIEEETKDGVIFHELQYHTKNGTRFYIDYMLQKYSELLEKKIRADYK